MLESVKEATVRKLMYYEVPDPKALVAHIEQEQKRREAIEQQMRATHASTEPVGEEGEEALALDPNSPLSPDEQKARLLAQKKARRKAAR
jgi:hypothetical protein